MPKKTHDYGDAPVDEKYRQQMIAIVKTLDEFINGSVRPRKNGLLIMMFPFGEGPGRCNYMSNGVSREDVVVLMKEMIARFEGMPTSESKAKQ